MKECDVLRKMRQNIKEENWGSMGELVYPWIHLEHSAPIYEITQIQLNDTQQ